MRTRGSCIFAPYWKVQVWNGAAMAWKDIQKAHPTEKEARDKAPAGRYRLVMVTEQGRTFGPAEARP